MNKNIIFWISAIIITLASAIYQRMTGPTYPISGEVKFQNENIEYKFLRSNGKEGDQIVSIDIDDPLVEGKLFWKRYKLDEPFFEVEMIKTDSSLYAYLPQQPPAGKLEYFVMLQTNSDNIKIPAEENVVIRFKGSVPIWVLIPHVIAMFGAMLLSARTGLEFFKKEPQLNKLTYWTIGFLFVGGLILGPIVQKYAFDAYWTGVPFGNDLTDNKTLIAFLTWLAALLMYRKSPQPKYWALAASMVTLIVFLIPHSVMGSELDYTKMKKEELKIEMYDSTKIN